MIYQVNVFVCGRCHWRVRLAARQVDTFYLDPLVELPDGWQFRYWDDQVLCQRCAGK